MLFNSYTFFIFLFVVLIVSRLIASWSQRKTFLLLMSYLFYCAWNPPFVVLLWISTVADWFLAKKLDKATVQSKRKVFLFMSLFVNLGMLAYFKYATFLLSCFIGLLSTFGIEYTPAMPSIILPVGISFYTFQTLSYTLDVYRRRMKPATSFLDYALYVTFFPQLVAGPIVRAVDFLPQCVESKKASGKQLGWGLSLIVIGLFNKVVIADGLMASIVERVYETTDPLTFLDAWAGTMAFATQIFCDFSGYSTCAIGCAMCLGFVLPDNFRFPYAAIGFSDFWGRWHISLSTWLRDYLYISLGGNRLGHIRTYVNLMVTMLLGGLWHGASWMFVIWGGLHGGYLIAERKIKQCEFSKHVVWSHFLTRVFLSLITFGLVCITWVFFRASNMEQATSVLASMLDPLHFGIEFSGVLSRGQVIQSIGVTFAMLILHNILAKSSLEALFNRIPVWVSGMLLALLMYVILVSMSGVDHAFIYFQF